MHADEVVLHARGGGFQGGACCGIEVSPTLVKIRAGGGCKFCATHGIDLAGPSKVYVITHREWKAVKIGIGACTGYASRLIQHERQGWQLHQARDYTTGAAAYDVEQAVLSRLRQAGLIPFLTSDVMPNGWTEACSAAHVTAAEVWATVDEETRNAEEPYAPRVGGRPVPRSSSTRRPQPQKCGPADTSHSCRIPAAPTRLGPRAA
ncbi:hypothetical protein [Streptomyces fulvoviolaceus]|uniref:hypothetical protein n=1 Tax=Streptomyces fulvoviolaceus TaxID=285535 RepID=UPI00131E8BB9|nr:hypothetical protein [Streptomyces fulvoviolaceus]